MPDRIAAGTEIDGYHLDERVHVGTLSEIFRVSRPGAEFPLLMKLPRSAPGDAGEGLVNFETEAMILPTLSGPHVPRFVAAGDLARVPYLVVEWIEGTSLESMVGRAPLAADEVARVGAALADALHSLHLQDTIYLDLKPANAILRPNGAVVLIDFGLAHHAHFPDLIAEEERLAAGSAPYISPEQVLGERGDPRSDLFALGVVLYELATGELPFGVPATRAGLRDRIWRDPVPPAARSPDVPPWLQEIVLRCLEPRAENRYQSAAHVAFDLRNPDQVALTPRALKSRQRGIWAQLRHWWSTREERPARRAMPRAQVGGAPVILVAVDTLHPEDERHPGLQSAVMRIISIPEEFRLMCVSVIPAGPGAESTTAGEAAATPYHEHLVRLRHWVEPLRLPASRLSLHVIESASASDTLLEFAQRNNVDLIVLGAPQPRQLGLAWWRSVASAVTANARCSVHVVRVPAPQTGEPETP
jgi:nucleotide-binding universal stress UspA family protein